MGSMQWYSFEERSKQKENLPVVEQAIRESIAHVDEAESQSRNQYQATMRSATFDLDEVATKVEVHVERATAGGEKDVPPSSETGKTANDIVTTCLRIFLDVF